jgi:hypothetical protein
MEVSMIPPIDPPTSTDSGSNPFAFVALNPFLARWLDAVAGDQCLSPEASIVAAVMAESVGVGRISFTNWQQVNASLGRGRREHGVFESIKELQSAGYLGRFQGNRYNKSRGWSLLIPGAEL